MFEVGDKVRVNANYNEGSLEGEEGVIVEIWEGKPFPYHVEFYDYMEFMKESEIDLCES
jgi:hypothetical protein